ncbi:hypothetical protein LJR260_004399 [Variovorax paradoxus]|uniref:hypothetical protein n=1 Tax=Variovorax paradoxus TaxID=34073 RepID=UPI003ECE9979
MRLILAQYLATLRERDEFDRLLPELLQAMDYVPLAKPQTGVRQFGVDFAAVGVSPDDGIKEVLLFVIKQGNIGRKEWSADEPADLRPTLNEVLDAFIPTHLAPEYRPLRKVIIVATTGGFKQDMQLNWAGYEERYKSIASFQQWPGERVAGLLEAHLLNENLFANEDRSDLRKALALSGDRDYAFGDFLRLLQRQLGLKDDGSLMLPPLENDKLLKAIRRVSLATQICAHWAQADGDSRQAIWVMERALLWVWHRVQLTPQTGRRAFHAAMADMWSSYLHVATHFLEVMKDHFSVKDGMSGYARENAEYSLVLFEHIGLLSSIGLAQLMVKTNDANQTAIRQGNADVVAGHLDALIRNHAAAASPRLDRNVVEINLALVLLTLTNHHQAAQDWIKDMVLRLHFNFQRKKMFPIGSDSLDDLADLETLWEESRADALMSTSWMLATLAAWSALQHIDDAYQLLVKGKSTDYANVCAQLWHPTKDWPSTWYFSAAHHELGNSEAPFTLPEDPAALRARLDEFLAEKRYAWEAHSPALDIGFWALDILACRHFKTPVPASFWYRVAQLGSLSAERVTEATQTPPV